MTASPTPKSTSSTGNIRVAWVPGYAANPLSVAVLAATTTKDVTFSMNGSGYTPNTNENSIADSRLGARQVLNKRGNFTQEVSVEYVYGDVNDVARIAMAEGAQGYLVVRRGVPNETDWATGQSVVVHTGECGKQMIQPPAENSIDTIKQNLFLSAPDQQLVATVA